jgi:DNA-binding response OmpR family regulator
VSDASKGTVLVVEDEPTIADMVARYLRRAGYETSVVGDGRAALAAVGGRRPDLVLLDVMLPGMDGLEVMRRLRETEGTTRLAILLLTARGGESDRVAGLQQGADDYVVKPFSPAELIARVEAVLRRTAGAEPESALRFDGLEIDVSAHRVTRDGEEIALTHREFDLLLFLARHPGQAFSRDQLMQDVWRYSFFTDTATVTVHVRRLRSKLERDPSSPRWLETVWGVGYRFRA